MGSENAVLEGMGPELELLLPMLDERARRLVLGAVARAAGEGGTTSTPTFTDVYTSVITPNGCPTCHDPTVGFSRRSQYHQFDSGEALNSLNPYVHAGNAG